MLNIKSIIHLFEIIFNRQRSLLPPNCYFFSIESFVKLLSKLKWKNGLSERYKLFLLNLLVESILSEKKKISLKLNTEKSQSLD